MGIWYERSVFKPFIVFHKEQQKRLVDEIRDDFSLQPQLYTLKYPHNDSTTYQRIHIQLLNKLSSNYYWRVVALLYWFMVSNQEIHCWWWPSFSNSNELMQHCLVPVWCGSWLEHSCEQMAIRFKYNLSRLNQILGWYFNRFHLDIALKGPSMIQ